MFSLKYTTQFSGRSLCIFISLFNMSSENVLIDGLFFRKLTTIVTQSRPSFRQCVLFSFALLRFDRNHTLAAGKNTLKLEVLKIVF